MYLYVYCTHTVHVHILPAAILLGTLRMPYKEVRNLILLVDPQLTEQMLVQLLKFLPKKEAVS